jgi:hypothetical protein
MKFSHTDSARLPGTDFEMTNFESGVCPGVISSIGSCVLTHPYLVGNYEGDAGYIPWSMPEVAAPSTLMMASFAGESRDAGMEEIAAMMTPATSSADELSADKFSNVPASGGSVDPVIATIDSASLDDEHIASEPMDDAGKEEVALLSVSQVPEAAVSAPALSEGGIGSQDLGGPNPASVEPLLAQ